MTIGEKTFQWLLVNCSNTFSDFLVRCPDSIKVNSYLDPTTEYKWVITDKFQKQHSGYSTTDADGHFEIPVDDLPDGLLNQYAGDFTLEIFATTGVYGQEQCNKVQIPIAKNYDSIVFHVKAGTSVKENLGCEIV
jgi:hypothetical protein